MYASVSRRLAVSLSLTLSLSLAAGAVTVEEPCAPATRASGWHAPVVVAGDRIATLDEAAGAAARVYFVGESHERYDHHLNQLEIVCRLLAQGRRVAIGMEMFQRPFQPALDDFIAGRIDLDTLLLRSEYFDRWRYDPRLYAPILEFARDHAIPVIALNVDAALLRTVAGGGLEALEAPERARLPGMLPVEPAAYRERLRAIYDRHPAGPDRTFERFLASQVLWDETMADTAARFLAANPGSVLVVFAGNGHIAWGDGIPARVARRIGAPAIAVVNDTPGRGAEPASGDYVLLSAPLALEAPGLLGLFLDEGEDGLTVAKTSEGGAAEAAGIVAGERIEQVAGRAVRRFAEVKAALWRAPPGTPVALLVRGTDGAQRAVELALR